MSLLFVQLLSGLANAMFLFLVASGLSLIFGVTRIVNFAHGSFYMLAAYLTYSLTAALSLGPAAFYAAVILAALIVAALGGLVEVLLLRRVYRAPELYQLLLTFALVLIAADAVRYIWGADNKTGPSAPGLAGSVPIAGQLFPSCSLCLSLASKRQSVACRAHGTTRRCGSALHVRSKAASVSMFSKRSKS